MKEMKKFVSEIKKMYVFSLEVGFWENPLEVLEVLESECKELGLCCVVDDDNFNIYVYSFDFELIKKFIVENYDDDIDYIIKDEMLKEIDFEIDFDVFMSIVIDSDFDRFIDLSYESIIKKLKIKNLKDYVYEMISESLLNNFNFYDDFNCEVKSIKMIDELWGGYDLILSK